MEKLEKWKEGVFAESRCNPDSRMKLLDQALRLIEELAKEIGRSKYCNHGYLTCFEKDCADYRRRISQAMERAGIETDPLAGVEAATEPSPNDESKACAKELREVFDESLIALGRDSNKVER